MWKKRHVHIREKKHKLKTFDRDMKTLEGEQNRSRSGAACIEPHQVLRVQHIKSVTTTIYTNVHTYTRQPNGTHHVRVFIST